MLTNDPATCGLVGEPVCYVLSASDYTELMAEREQLYRELKAACRALGHSAGTCTPSD